VPKKYRVQLDGAQRERLERLIASGSAPARTLTYARVLLKADESVGGPAWQNAQIAEALEISTLTVTRVRKRFDAGGVETALQRKVQEHRKERALDGTQEAYLIALACSAAPTGRERWTLRLLAEQMVVLGYVEELSHETVRQALKRGSSNPG
jgi:hypothetical protein